MNEQERMIIESFCLALEKWEKPLSQSQLTLLREAIQTFQINNLNQITQEDVDLQNIYLSIFKDLEQQASQRSPKYISLLKTTDLVLIEKLKQPLRQAAMSALEEFLSKSEEIAQKHHLSEDYRFNRGELYT